MMSYYLASFTGPSQTLVAMLTRGPCNTSSMMVLEGAVRNYANQQERSWNVIENKGSGIGTKETKLECA